MLGRRAPAATAIRRALPILCSVLSAGCTRDGRRPQPAREEIIAWDFPAEAPGPPLLSLWPASPETPQRRKHDLATTRVNEALEATVTGKDPGFSWDLPGELEARIVHLVLTVSAAGEVQFFWASRTCPTFSETCSTRVAVAAGKNAVDLALRRDAPLRSIRLDLPEVPGARVLVHSFTLSTDAVANTVWKPLSGTSAESHADGLHIMAAGGDPGITVSVPGMDASAVTAIEVVLRAASGPVQLFWEGPCGAFSERCSAFLEGADANALTHRAALVNTATWASPIRALRFDPTPGKGEVILERLALVRDVVDVPPSPGPAPAHP